MFEICTGLAVAEGATTTCPTHTRSNYLLHTNTQTNTPTPHAPDGATTFDKPPTWMRCGRDTHCEARKLSEACRPEGRTHRQAVQPRANKQVQNEYEEAVRKKGIVEAPKVMSMHDTNQTMSNLFRGMSSNLASQG